MLKVMSIKSCLQDIYANGGHQINKYFAEKDHGRECT
jgi:hypothetical protein